MEYYYINNILTTKTDIASHSIQITGHARANFAASEYILHTANVTTQPQKAIEYGQVLAVDKHEQGTEKEQHIMDEWVGLNVKL